MVTGDGGWGAIRRAPRHFDPHGPSRRSAMLRALVLVGTAWLAMVAPAQAALVVMPNTLVLELESSAVGIVRGDITNTTGFGLLSTDFFGSFSGFPADALIVDQLLGLTDVVIDDRSIVRDLALFSVQLGVGAQTGERYAIEFFFGDVNGNFSEAATVFVDVAGAQQISEPGVAWLVGGGLLGLAASRRRPPSSPQET